MDTVFIDTSVFVSENFLEGKRILEIYRLAKDGYLQLVVPVITYNEIMSRIQKSCSEALQGYKVFREKTKALRNIPSFEKRFDRIDENAAIQELQNLFGQQLESLNSIIVPYPMLNIEEVFAKYFANETPFSTGEKKHEFPDAFTLATLEHWSKETKRHCIVIAGDKDIAHYTSKYLTVVPSINHYLDDTLRKIAAAEKKQKRIELATELYASKITELRSRIEVWITEQLEDSRTYRKHVRNEIHEIEIDLLEIELSEPQITAVTDHSIQLSTQFDIIVEVSLEMDDFSSGWYDNEDETWRSSDTERERISKDRKLPVVFEVDFPIAGDEYADITIASINNGKDLEF